MNTTRFFLAMLTILFLTACATMGLGNMNGAQRQAATVAEQGTVKFGTILAIQHVAKNDPAKAAALATKARATLDEVDKILDNPNTSVSMTLQQLHDQVSALIAKQGYGVGTLVAVDTVRQLVDTAILDLAQGKSMNQALTPGVVSGIKTTLASIRDGLTLAGY